MTEERDREQGVETPAACDEGQTGVSDPRPLRVGLNEWVPFGEDRMLNRTRS